MRMFGELLNSLIIQPDCIIQFYFGKEDGYNFNIKLRNSERDEETNKKFSVLLISFDDAWKLLNANNFSNNTLSICMWKLKRTTHLQSIKSNRVAFMSTFIYMVQLLMMAIWIPMNWEKWTYYLHAYREFILSHHMHE